MLYLSSGVRTKENRQMKTIAIVAAARNRVIGQGNQIPWRLKNDLRYFKRITMGHYVLMGRKSLESLGKPLKGRMNLVITRNKDFQMEGVHVFNSIKEAYEWAKKDGAEQLFIAGGGEIYSQTIPLWDLLYYTDVKTEVSGEVYFPELNWGVWELYYSEFHSKNDEDEHDFTIQFLKRT